MKVSVIVPAWNVEMYLNKCLDSVMAQTFSDFECIVADDGSQDRTEMIIDSYMAQDARVKCLKLEHNGLSAARNAALAQATGEYVLCLDADDWLEPDALASLAGRMDADALDMLLYNCAAEFEDDETRARFGAYETLGDRKHAYDGVFAGAKLLSLLNEHGEYVTMVCLYMFRRGLLAENGIRFIDGLVYEDMPFTFECLLAARRTAVLNRRFYHRRVRPGSITTSDCGSAARRARYVTAATEMERFAAGRVFPERVQRSVDMTLNFARFLGKRA